MSRVPEALFVALAGGLGNQMFQYAAGRAIAGRLKCALRLDLSGFGKDRLRSYALDAFDIKAVPAGDAEVARLRKRERLLPGFVRRALARRGLRPDPRVFREPHWHYSPAVDTLRAPVLIIGYWQSPRYFSGIRTELSKTFRPTAPLSDYSAGLRRHIKASEAVAVHIRRGDYVTNPSAARRMGLCDVDYYRHAVDLLTRLVPQARFYLFSDDAAFVREAFSFVPNQTIVDGNGDRAVEDMMLMRDCTHHIIANSSFSWWGAWLGEDERKIVVAPRRWFSRERLMTTYTFDLYPDDWITLG